MGQQWVSCKSGVGKGEAWKWAVSSGKQGEVLLHVMISFFSLFSLEILSKTDVVDKYIQCLLTIQQRLLYIFYVLGTGLGAKETAVDKTMPLLSCICGRE